MAPNKPSLAPALAALLLGLPCLDIACGPPTAQGWDKESVRKRLKALNTAKPEPPLPLAMAMCYDPGPSGPPDPERADYLCPACGQRTLYAPSPKTPGGDGLPTFIRYALPELRAQARAIQGLTVTLDERYLCHRCSTKTEAHDLVLVVRTTDGVETRTLSKSAAEDLEILDRFTTAPHPKKPVFKPEEASRLRELLGNR